MGFREIDASFTIDGRLRLSDTKLNSRQVSFNAGACSASHYIRHNLLLILGYFAVVMLNIGSVNAQTAYIGCQEIECETLELPEPKRAFVFHRKGYVFESEIDPTDWFERLRLNMALRKFPTVQSCLSPDAATPEGLDLTKVDWQRWENPFDAEVCLARIIDRIASVPLTVAWLKELGFEVPQVGTSTWFHEGTSLISPIWTGTGRRPLAWRAFGILPRQSRGLDMRLKTEDGMVLTISLIVNLL